MNKLFKLTTALLLALAITACGKKDPKEDYKKFIDWNNAQLTQQNQIVSEFQQSLSTAKNADEITAVLKKYQDSSNALIASLEKLDVSTPDIVEYKQKYKAALQLSLDVTVTSIQSMIKPLSSVEKAQLQGQLTELQTELQDIENTNKALQQKYGESEEATSETTTEDAASTDSETSAEATSEAPAETAPATEAESK